MKNINQDPVANSDVVDGILKKFGLKYLNDSVTVSQAAEYATEIISEYNAELLRARGLLMACYNIIRQNPPEAIEIINYINAPTKAKQPL